MTLSTQEKVTQAVAEHMEMLEELASRKTASGVLAGLRSKARSNPAVVIAAEKAAEEMVASAQSSEETRAFAVSKAGKTLEGFKVTQAKALRAAVAECEGIEVEAKEIHDEYLGSIQVTHDKKVSTAQEAHERAVRDTTAEAHVAARYVLDQEHSIEEHRKRIQVALGIDLASFVKLPE